MLTHKTARLPAAKNVVWMGCSKEDLLAFPRAVVSELGRQLLKVQFGDAPDDFSPMSTVGQGAYEIRQRDARGWYRVIYVAKFEKAVYVLHSFQKKTNTTPTKDIALARARYSEAKKDSER